MTCEYEPPTRCPKCDTPFEVCVAEIQTFGEHICMQFVNHKRPDGRVCAYMADGVCNKCGWTEVKPL